MSEFEILPSQDDKREKMQKRFTVNKLSKKHWFIIAAICSSFYVGWFFIIRWADPNPGAAIGLVFGVLATSVLSIFVLIGLVLVVAISVVLVGRASIRKKQQ